MAFSPDGHRLASASYDTAVRLWNPDTGQPLGDPLTCHTGTVWSVAFRPDGHRLASAGADGTVRLWNPETGRSFLRGTLTGPDLVRGVAFRRPPTGHPRGTGTPHGHRQPANTVRVWDADTGQPLGAPLTGHTGRGVTGRGV